MAIIQFSNGMKVNFNGTPSQADIEEVASQIQNPQPQGNNFLQNAITDPLKELFIQPVVRAGQAFSALGGNETAGTQDVNLNLGPLGKINIPGLGPDQGQAGGKYIAGSALKTAGYLAPGLGEGSVLAQAGKNALAGSAFGSGQALEDNAPLPQVVEQGLIGGGVGAGASLGLSALGAAAGKVIAPFQGSFDNEAAQVAEKYGIKLPASSVTSSDFVKNMEALASKGPFGKTLQDMVTEAGDRINGIADEVVAKAGSTDLIQGGQDILNAQKDFQSTWVKTKNALYDSAQKIAGREPIAIQPTNTIDFLKSVITQKELASAAGPAGKDTSFFQEFLDKLDRQPTTVKGPDFVTNEAGMTKAVPQPAPIPAKPVTLQEAQAALKELNNKLSASFKNPDPVVSSNIGTMRRLAATLSGDIDKALPDDIKLAAAQADAYYKQGLQKLNSSYGKKINLYQNQPDKIIPALFNKSTSLAEIPQMLSYIGSKNADNVRANVLDAIISSAKSATTDEFTTGSLTRQINKFGEDKLKALLKPEQFTALKDLETLSKALQGGKKIAQGSQTSFIGKTLLEIGVVFAHPLLALKAVVSDAAFSKFISSNMGQDLLKGGFTLPGSAVSRGLGVRVPSQLARLVTSSSASAGSQQKPATKIRVPKSLSIQGNQNR